MKIRNATTWALAVAMLVILSGGAYGQPAPTTDPTTSLPSIRPADYTPPSSSSPDLSARQAKMLNDSRQKQLVLDTQKLVVLANELKMAVDKSGKDTLSLDVVRKADEIEKLAHSVKEKMKGN